MIQASSGGQTLPRGAAETRGALFTLSPPFHHPLTPDPSLLLICPQTSSVRVSSQGEEQPSCSFLLLSFFFFFFGGGESSERAAFLFCHFLLYLFSPLLCGCSFCAHQSLLESSGIDRGGGGTVMVAGLDRSLAGQECRWTGVSLDRSVTMTLAALKMRFL